MRQVRSQKMAKRSASLATLLLSSWGGGYPAAVHSLSPSSRGQRYIPRVGEIIGGRHSFFTAGSSSSTTALPCQLLGMNAAHPTSFSFSFRGFARRGGITDVHSDGWGLAFYEGRGLRTFHDSASASESVVARMVEEYPVKTVNMLAHIRYATAGEVCLENVHPFQREMWGIIWCFAHNGDVPLFKSKLKTAHAWIGDVPGERVYSPVGDTDSEAIFCALLNALKAKFETLPSLPVLHDYINKLCKEIVSANPDETILNFLLGCGRYVQFSYSWPGARPGSTVWNGLYYIVREPPFTEAHLSDMDYAVDFSEMNTDEDRVAIIATKPLTLNEEWVEIEKGELILFDQGIPHKVPEECFKIEFLGHGLDSDVMLAPKLEEDMRRYQFERSYYEGIGI